MKNHSLFGGIGWHCAIFLICLAISPAFATRHTNFVQQQQNVTGKVLFDHMPMAGVTIAVKGISHIAISDIDGNFTIEAGPTDTLLFSYVGFATVSEPVNGRTHINVTLTEDATALQEVTVNAGYYNVKESETTGSISKVSAATIDKQPVGDVLATMQGRLAGVNITQETGIAGGGFNIAIRGINSLRDGGNSPLYVIDGVPYAFDPISDLQTTPALPGNGNPLSSINPKDIESFEILRDADATAIYGSRGANGVVLITTKRGKAGKTQFSISSAHAVGKVTRMMKLMDTQEYLAMRRQAFANDGLTPSDYNYDVNGKWDQSRYTDWQKELTGGTSEIDTWQASASGGSEQTKFLLSGNYRTETTVFPGDFLYKRGGAHLSTDHTSEDKKFKMSFSGSYTAQRNNLPVSDLTGLARYLAPNAPALYDGNGNLNWEDATWSNPVAGFNAKTLVATYDLVANTVLGYQATPSLLFKSSFGYTDLRNDESRSAPSTVYNPVYNYGSEYSTIYRNGFERRSWIVEPQINWVRNFGKSKVDVLAGGSFQNQQSDRLATIANGFASNALLYDMAAANLLIISNNETLVYKYQAFFGRVNYAFDGKYFLNITGRRDGSSRFGPGKQFATFGAVGAAWLLHKEKFLAHFPTLSFGKIRGSYGITGNDQIGDYQFLDTYTSSGYEYQGIKGLQPVRLFNPDFGWETNRKLEVAIEAGFFDDRLFMTGAWYRNRSSNQLVGTPLAATTGFTSMQTNLDATVENSGVEMTLRTVNVKTPNFNWSTSINVTLPKNKLVSFPGLAESGYKNTYVIGEPVTIVKLFQYEGVNPETGIYEFKDVNGDGSITYEDDRVAVRDMSPQYYGGLQNQFSYKGLQLDFLFQFVKQLNFNFAKTKGFAGNAANQPVEYTNSWSAPGQYAQYQILTTGVNQAAMTAGDYYAQSDAAVSDASYIRLKNVALSYDLLEHYIKGLKCRFSLQAQNLLTITSYQGADPEFKEAGYLPPLRVVSAGLQLTF
jgi:TonB-linked SusC/RagA family outer membrane protein